jgi:hypothetical protein
MPGTWTVEIGGTVVTIGSVNGASGPWNVWVPSWASKQQQEINTPHAFHTCKEAYLWAVARLMGTHRWDPTWNDLPEWMRIKPVERDAFDVLDSDALLP